jgi:hypothetical protein
MYIETRLMVRQAFNVFSSNVEEAVRCQVAARPLEPLRSRIAATGDDRAEVVLGFKRKQEQASPHKINSDYTAFPSYIQPAR